MPTEETDPPPSDVSTVEWSMICESGTGAKVEHLATETTGEDAEDITPTSDDWHCLVIPCSAATGHRSPLERQELDAEYRSTLPLFWKDVEESHPSASVDAKSEDIRLRSDTAQVPEGVFELPVQFTAESDRDETPKDRSVSLSTAADVTLPTASFDVPCWHSVSAHQPASQIMAGEVADLPPVQQIVGSSLVTSSSMFAAAVEVCQSSDQLLSMSACEPICAHPDVLCLEPSSDSESSSGRSRDDQRPVPFGARFPSESAAVDEVRQPDGGTVVRRRVVRTRVRRVATRRVRRRQPDGRLVEYTETVELPPAEEEGDDLPSELAASGAAAGQVVGVHADTADEQPRVDRDVEVVRETLADGRVVERRIVRTRQRRTVVKRVSMRPARSPRSDPA